MRTKAVALSLAVVALAFGRPAASAVRQVRVTAAHAAIYIEPSRTSTRIDLVEKGDLLNLFQQQKVKDVWYYVSYSSPRYASRISGFIQASAVELVTAEKPPAEKSAPAPGGPEPEKKPPEVTAPPPQPKAGAIPPGQKKSGQPVPAKAEAAVQKPPVAEYSIAIGITSLPRSRRVAFPRLVKTLEDLPWAFLEAAVSAISQEPEKPVASLPQPSQPQVAASPPTQPKAEAAVQKPPVAEYSIAIGITSLPRSRRVAFPLRVKSLEDLPWAVLEAAAPAISQEPEKPVPSLPQPSQPQVAAAQPSTPKSKIAEPAPAFIEYKEVIGLTRLPHARLISPPRRAAAIKDAPWASLEPASSETKREPMKPAVGVAPPTAAQVKPAIAKTTPEARRPAKTRPEPPGPVTPSAPQAAPVKPAFAPKAGPRQTGVKIGLGYGSSYGGAGGCVELGLTSRLAVHAGFGLYPTSVIFSETDWVRNQTLWSAGVRYYPTLASDRVLPYLDLQYGGLRVEAAQVVTGIFDYAFIYRHEQKTLWGPSLLAGLEIRVGRLGFAGGLGVAYNLTDWEFLKQRLALAFEAGLSVRL